MINNYKDCKAEPFVFNRPRVETPVISNDIKITWTLVLVMHNHSKLEDTANYFYYWGVRFRGQFFMDHCITTLYTVLR